jgi:LysR family glycine cleavage system transcriptional activator
MATDRLPPLNWLRAFEASARHLSFTGAANELNMTQSAISQQIKGLEAYLGKPLFRRLPRVLELTDTGRTYLPVVREAFGTLSRGTRSVVGPERGRVLELQSSLGFSVHWLAPRLPRLFAAHPWLRLNITTQLWEPQETDRDADVEIRFSLNPGTGMGVERLNWDHFYPVCAPGHAVDEAEILSHPLYDCSGLVCTWEAWFEGQGKTFPPRTVVTYATTYAVTLSAAMAGAGLALGHDTLVSDLIERGRLVRPFAHRQPMQEAYYLILAPRAAATPAAQAFAQWIRAEFAAARPAAKAP